MNEHDKEVRRRAALAIAKNITKGIPRPVLQISEPLTTAEKQAFIKKWREAMTSQSGFALAKAACMDTVPVRATFEFIPGKLFRVFYHAGVYEWYINDGLGPLWEYRKRGILIGAYNVRAKMCVPEENLRALK
jgi:hypothetical protein